MCDSSSPTITSPSDQKSARGSHVSYCCSFVRDSGIYMNVIAAKEDNYLTASVEEQSVWAKWKPFTERGACCIELKCYHRKGLQCRGKRGPPCTSCSHCVAQKFSSLVHLLSAAFSVSLLNEEQSCRLLACINLSVVLYAILKYDFLWGMVFHLKNMILNFWHIQVFELILSQLGEEMLFDTS